MTISSNLANIYLCKPSGYIPSDFTTGIKEGDNKKFTLPEAAKKCGVLLDLEPMRPLFTDKQVKIRQELKAVALEGGAPQFMMWQALLTLLIDVSLSIKERDLARKNVTIITSEGSVKRDFIYPLWDLLEEMSLYVSSNDEENLTTGKQYLKEYKEILWEIPERHVRVSRAKHLFSLLEKGMEDKDLLPLLFEPSMKFTDVNIHQIKVGFAEAKLHARGVKRAKRLFDSGIEYLISYLKAGLEKGDEDPRTKKRCLEEITSVLKRFQTEITSSIPRPPPAGSFTSETVHQKCHEYIQSMLFNEEVDGLLFPKFMEYRNRYRACAKKWKEKPYHDEYSLEGFLLTFSDMFVRPVYDSTTRTLQGVAACQTYWKTMQKILIECDTKLGISNERSYFASPLDRIQIDVLQSHSQFRDTGNALIQFGLTEELCELLVFFSLLRSAAEVFRPGSGATLAQKQAHCSYLLECIQTHLEAFIMLGDLDGIDTKKCQEYLRLLGKGITHCGGPFLTYLSSHIGDKTDGDASVFKELIKSVSYVADKFVQSIDMQSDESQYPPQATALLQWHLCAIRSLSKRLKRLKDDVNSDDIVKLMRDISDIEETYAQKFGDIDQECEEYIVSTLAKESVSVSEVLARMGKRFTNLFVLPLTALQEFARIEELSAKKTDRDVPLEPMKEVLQVSVEEEEIEEEAPAQIDWRARVYGLLLVAQNAKVQTTPLHESGDVHIRKSMCKGAVNVLRRCLEMVEFDTKYHALALEQCMKLVLAHLDIRADKKHILFSLRDEYSRQELRASHDLKKLFEALGGVEGVSTEDFTDRAKLYSVLAAILSKAFSVQNEGYAGISREIDGIEVEEKSLPSLTIEGDWSVPPFVPLPNENSHCSNIRWMTYINAQKQVKKEKIRIKELIENAHSQMDQELYIQFLSSHVHDLLEGTLLMRLAATPLAGKDSTRHFLLDSIESKTQKRPLRYSHRLDIFARALALCEEEQEVCRMLTGIRAFDRYGQWKEGTLSKNLYVLSLLHECRREGGLFEKEEGVTIGEYTSRFEKESSRVMEVLDKALAIACENRGDDDSDAA